MKFISMVSACSIAFAGLCAPANSASTESGGYEVIANAYGFGCAIDDCPEASKNIREIAIDELNVDIREMTTGLDVEYRLYGPGQAHWGQAKFSSACTLGGSKELQAWYQEAAKGSSIRKNITVTLYKSDKSPGRTYNLLDCFPTHWEEVLDEHGELVESIWVRPGRIEMLGTDSPPAPRAEATSSDKFAQVRGFKVEIGAAGVMVSDTAWESVSGGELIVELTDSTVGADTYQTNSPGHKTVGEITLRGAMTDGRKAMCQWINETVMGKDWRRSLTFTDISESKPSSPRTYIYHDCFPIRYVFPKLSVHNLSGPVCEEVVVKATREPLPKGTKGKLEIPDCPVASQDALALALDDRALDCVLFPRVGDCANPELKILLPPGSGHELEQWYQDSLVGKVKRKKITITVGNDKKTAKKYVLHDCFPTGFTRATPSTGNVMEEVRIKPIRVELK